MLGIGKRCAAARPGPEGGGGGQVAKVGLHSWQMGVVLRAHGAGMVMYIVVVLCVEWRRGVGTNGASGEGACLEPSQTATTNCQVYAESALWISACGVGDVRIRVDTFVAGGITRGGYCVVV